jgi:hypothetical protein
VTTKAACSLRGVLEGRPSSELFGQRGGESAESGALGVAEVVELGAAPHGVHLVAPDAFAGFVGKVGAWR